MSIYNIHFHDVIKFIELSEEFPRDSKTSSYQPRYTSSRGSSKTVVKSGNHKKGRIGSNIVSSHDVKYILFV